MNLYTDKDLEIFKNNIDTIIDKANEISMSTVEPTSHEIKKNMPIVLNYIKSIRK